MGSANLDLVRSIMAGWERGDFGSAEWAHPEIEFAITDFGPASGTWSGSTAMAVAFRDFLRVWEGFRVEAEEYFELDGERVFVLIQQRGRGKTSGVELGQVRTQGANLWHLRSGKVTKLVLYFDRDCALTDLGLPPEGDAADSS